MRAAGLLDKVATPHTVVTDLMHGLNLPSWDRRLGGLNFFAFRQDNNPLATGTYPAPAIRVPRGTIFHAETSGHRHHIKARAAERHAHVSLTRAFRLHLPTGTRREVLGADIQVIEEHVAHPTPTAPSAHRPVCRVVSAPAYRRGVSVCG